MGIIDRIKDLGKFLQGKIDAELKQKFPGLTLEAIKQGWIPVPEEYLERELREKLSDIESLRLVSLRCVPKRFVIEVESARWNAAQRIKLDLVSEEFVVDSAKSLAVFRCDGPLKVEGRNLFGKATAWLAKALIEGALQSAKTGETIDAATAGVVDLRWPKIMVHLERMPKVDAMLEAKLLGLRVRDFIVLGPLAVQDGHVRLKIAFAPRFAAPSAI